MPWRGTCTCGSLIWSWPPWPEVCHHNIVFLIADMGSKLCFKCLGNSHGFLLNFERRLSEKFQPVHMLPKVKNVILCCYFKAYLSFYQSSGCIIYKWKSAVGPLQRSFDLWFELSILKNTLVSMCILPRTASKVIWPQIWNQQPWLPW